MNKSDEIYQALKEACLFHEDHSLIEAAIVRDIKKLIADLERMDPQLAAADSHLFTAALSLLAELEEVRARRVRMTVGAYPRFDVEHLSPGDKKIAHLSLEDERSDLS